MEDPPVPLGAIAAISASLASAPHGELVRRQTAVRIDGRRVTQLFQELSISVPALEARIGMRVPASADPYLFRYLSGQLDQGMLEPLARADLSEIAALNINLPLASASSLGFAALQFAAKRAGMRLGIELAFVEVVADMRRFTAIRDRLQAEGCRVVLDGIDHHTLLHCDPSALQPDLVKLEWSALMPTQPARDGRRLRAALERIGVDRIVLCRAETEAAMVWGHGPRHLPLPRPPRGRDARRRAHQHLPIFERLFAAAVHRPRGRDRCGRPGWVPRHGAAGRVATSPPPSLATQRDVTGGGFDRLAALVANCTAAGVARQAFVLRIDRLPPALTRPHHLRLAEAALAPLLRLPRAELFHLPGPSLAVTWRGDAEAELLDVIDELEHLLIDPALSGPALSELICLYDLPETGDLLLGAFADDLAQHDEAGNPGAPLDPTFLTLLETCLAQADVSRFARRESVWQMDGTRIALAWEDRTLSIAELTEELAPGLRPAGRTLAVSTAHPDAGSQGAGAAGQPGGAIRRRAILRSA